MAAQDSDELAFKALLADVLRSGLLIVVRQLTEIVVNTQVVTEARPGAARDHLAQEALTLAAR